ncbi:MAG: flavin reductase family protein [Actinomycetota bacterium]|nr:flavin reductase family protein [Actinomycetota bacterium]
MTRSTEPPHTPVTPAVYREVLGRFATGVTVVTIKSPSTGDVRGMTANAFMSVSLDPPLVLVSVRRDARAHPLLHESGRYGVSLLGERLEREARRFAGMPVAAYEPTPTFEEHSGTPILRDALGWLVATIVDEHPVGDHTLFIGEIVDLATGHPSQRPLGFYRSSFAEVSVLEGRGPVPIEPWDHPLKGLWG